MDEERKDLFQEELMRKAFKKTLNSINNDQLIKIGDNWVFSLDEEEDFQNSPVTPHHFISRGLSINVCLELKWALYGWFYFKSLLEALNHEWSASYMTSSDAINPKYEAIKYEKMLFLNRVEVGSVDLLKIQLESEFYNSFLNENDKVSFKLKLNASEFVAMQNQLFPNMGELS